MPTITQLRADYKELVFAVLPSISLDRGFPVQNDHCFARILLDNLFQGCWYKHLDSTSKTPAFKQLSKEQLESVIATARGMVSGTVSVNQLNKNSLKWRGRI